jgi:PST family polysaccharide transporter
MIKNLKRTLIGTEEKKRLVDNILSLSVLQGANYILPLLTLPYLVRTLGPEYFGLIAFAVATIAYFVLITDYGFNLSATRQISIHRDNKDKIDELFSSVMIIKAVLMIVSFCLMTMLVLSVDKFRQHWELYFITFGMVLGQVLFPVWLFQGMERMKYITYLNIGAKTFFTVCIFMFVQDQSDYLLVPLLTVIGSILTGICSLYLVRKEFKVTFNLQSISTLKFQLSEGKHVFFSSIAISLYTISTTFILGSLTSNTVVGYFAAADKIVQAVKGLYTPVSQAIYPLIGKKIHDNKQSGLAFIKKTTWIISSSMFVISAILFLLAEQIVNFLLGAEYKQSIILLKIMSFLPFIIALSNIYGIQIMLNLGFKQAFSRILVAAATSGIGLSFILVPLYEGIGSAVTLIVVEILVTITMYTYLRGKGY